MGSGAGDIYAGAHGASAASDVSIAGEQSSRVDAYNTRAKPVDESPSAQATSIEAGFARLDECFELHEIGYLCDRGIGSKGRNRQYVSADPLADARKMFDALTAGSRVKDLDNGKGLQSRLSDGTYIVFREVTSTPGSPAVSIDYSPSPKIKNQKIHFVKGGS